MSDIKFACPYCSQHIACDAGYASLAIDCPSCGQPMVVPRLTPAEPGSSSMVIVAPTSATAPPPLIQTHRPPLAWTEEEWARRAGPDAEITGRHIPGLVIVAVALIVSALMRAHHAPLGLVLGWLILCGAIAGVFLARGGATNWARTLLIGVTVLLLLPVLGLGILFLGCAACAVR